MQSRNDDIEALRDILHLAKEIFCANRKDDPFHSNREIYGNALSAFSMIGKEKFYELVPDVYQFIDCKDTVLRETAVTTLGLSTRLHLPEFKEMAYKIWLEDEEDIVRNAALRAWASYYDSTQDRTVLKILYKILLNENYPVECRHSALIDIFSVADEPYSKYESYNKKSFYMISSHEEFNQKVDWDEIRAIMKKYAPEALQQ